MLKNKQTNKDKELLKLEREHNRLCKLSWHAPLVKLAHPYQNGWLKGFQLRDDISRRTDAAIFRRILTKINTIIFCRTKNFVKRNGETMAHDIDVIGKNEWEGLNWPEHYKKYFIFGYVKHNNRMIECYRFAYPYYFVEKITPHFVTHQRAVIPEVESRKQEIRNKLGRGLWNRLDNLHGRRKGSDDWRLSKIRTHEALGTKEIEEIRYNTLRFNPYKIQDND